MPPLTRRLTKIIAAQHTQIAGQVARTVTYAMAGGPRGITFCGFFHISEFLAAMLNPYHLPARGHILVGGLARCDGAW